MLRLLRRLMSGSFFTLVFAYTYRKVDIRCLRWVL